MKKSYKIFWICLILLIPILPLSGIFYGVDISDVGLSINQYRFCFEDIDSVYLPILLSELMGGLWLKICGMLSIPLYVGVEIMWVLACYYMSFLSCRIYKRYRDDSLVLPALALALLFAKCNFHYFIYATGVAVMALTALYFLIISLNEKKPALLAAAVFFVVMACLCKISSMAQFAVFAVLFYDFYKKKDGAYFVRQLAFCVLGFVVGIAAALLLIQATCGVDAYADMIVEMFLYAGNSQDGHTLGEMLMSNVKGALRGFVFLAVFWAIYVISQKFPKTKKGIMITIPVLLLLLGVGKLVGIDQLPVAASLYYSVIFRYLNALAMVVALVYVCMILILRDESYTQEFKNLSLSAGILLVLMPIGSNTGIQHICNEIYFALPFIVICVGDRVRRTRWIEEFREKRVLPPMGVFLTLLAAVWCVSLTVYQGLYLTRDFLTEEGEIAAYTLPELKGMRYRAEDVESLEEAAFFLKQYEPEYKEDGRKLLVAGNAPILNFLSGMPPYNAGCGGWIETEFITYEKIETQLTDVEIYPVVVFCKDAIEDPKPKIQLVIDFVEENAYEEVFHSEAYSIYVPVTE